MYFLEIISVMLFKNLCLIDETDLGGGGAQGGAAQGRSAQGGRRRQLRRF